MTSEVINGNVNACLYLKNSNFGMEHQNNVFNSNKINFKNNYMNYMLVLCKQYVKDLTYLFWKCFNNYHKGNK